MTQQHTLSSPVFLSGIGLHSGNLTSIAIHPAPVNSGIIFVKQINNALSSCPATIHNLGQTDHCTTLQSDDFQVQTVEHVLAALAGLEIDNAYIEVQGNEIPALDGSAAPFVEAIQAAGRRSQEELRRFIKIIQPIHVEDGQRSIAVFPSALPHISYFIDFPHPMIQQQDFQHTCTLQAFTKNIAAARTFAFKQEIEFLWSRGLGLGGSLGNTIVFSDSGLMNEEDLRFQDECVRHKVLDLIGDLSLIGVPIIGRFEAKRAGHLLHTQLVQAILNNPDKWITINSGTTSKPDMLHHIASISHSTSLPDLQPAFLSA